MIHDNLELFEMQLQEMYFIENKLIDVLKEHKNTSTNEMLKEGFAAHEKETRDHVKRLEEAFKLIGSSAKEQTTPVLKSMVDERKAVLKQKLPQEMIDMVNLASGIRVEHMEIGFYESLINMANYMDFKEVAGLLEDNMKEEEAALKKLKAVTNKDMFSNFKEMITRH